MTPAPESEASCIVAAASRRILVLTVGTRHQEAQTRRYDNCRVARKLCRIYEKVSNPAQPTRVLNPEPCDDVGLQDTLASSGDLSQRDSRGRTVQWAPKTAPPSARGCGVPGSPQVRPNASAPDVHENAEVKGSSAQPRQGRVVARRAR